MSQRIKSRSVKVGLPKKNVFKSTEVAVIVNNDKIDIENAIKENETALKEEVLLIQELEKPFASRNQALMRKFGYSEPGANVDRYPDIGGDVKYKVKVYAPEAAGVPIEKRPKPWYVAVLVGYAGDEFSFHFPIARSTAYQDEIVYKLDGFDVFLNPSFDIIDDISIYSLYNALLDFKNKDLARADLIGDVFVTFGVTTMAQDVFNASVKKDFRVRNQGFITTFTVNRAKSVAEPKVTPAVTKTTLKGKNFDGYTTTDNYGVFNSNTATAKKVIAKAVNHQLLGLEGTKQIPKKDLYLDAVLTNKTMSLSTWFALSSYDAESQTLGLTIINGARSLVGVIPGYNGTAAQLEAYLKKVNQRLYKAYKDKETVSILDQFTEAGITTTD